MSEPLWELQRTWDLLGDERAASVTTVQLAEFDSVVMLGVAGIGKSVEARRLEEYERSIGREVRWHRLAASAGSTDQFDRALASLSSNATSNTTLILDALDEAMVPLKRCWTSVEGWLRASVANTGAKVRVTCRPVVWQSALTTAMKDMVAKGRHAVASLRPLGDEDIALAAFATGIEGAAFVREVRERRAELLAAHPLTLRMLLRVKRNGVELPSSLASLFERAVHELAADQSERFELDTQDPRSIDEILRTAEAVACHTVLAGRHRISLRDAPPDEAFLWSDLSPKPDLIVSREALLSLARSGLCDSRSPGVFEFVHRQVAEYLAGRRIARLLAHQARPLLASPAGWKAGVAGPLRETAAFSAMCNPSVAEWITEHDPEVVGVSDVADSALRRQALLGLLGRFRLGAMTDAQVARGELELRGFRYEGAELDLRQALAERHAGAADVLECVVEIIKAWPLLSMSEDLATLMLDPSAPLHPRIAAGHALLELGSSASRARILPLAAGNSSDPHSELKALAIRCNWPERITTPKLLRFLNGRPKHHVGAFDVLLYQLDEARFDASGHRVEGLCWAAANFSEVGDSDPAHRIAMRIAHAAARDVDNEAVVDALATLILARSERHESSPLNALTENVGKEGASPELTPPLAMNEGQRRVLIDAIVARSADARAVGWLARSTPGMCNIRDFEWLLRRATDGNRPMLQRACYGEIARWIPWSRRLACVVVWWPLRHKEPIATSLAWQVPRSPREWFQMRTARARQAIELVLDKWRYRPRQPKPRPSRRVALRLSQAEGKDVCAFNALCLELTLTRKSTEYGPSRFITRTPGWERASERTRRRIVAVARSFLLTQSDYPTRASEHPLTEIWHGGMAAMWLLFERDSAWLKERDASWWATWCWYILRELRPNMIDEAEAPKASLLNILRACAPDAVRAGVVRMACDVEDAAMLLDSTLRLLVDAGDPRLDSDLLSALAGRRVRHDRIGSVAEFVLRRDSSAALPVVSSLLKNPDGGTTEAFATSAAAAMLFEAPQEGWEHITGLLEAHPSIGRDVLSRFAHGCSA